MTGYATVADVADRWRPLTDAQTVVAAALLGDAAALLRARVAGLDDRLDDGTLDPDLVRQVTCAMVLRVLRNPDGKASEQVDDYAWRRADTAADGRLTVTDEELDLLRPAPDAAGAFTITPW